MDPSVGIWLLVGGGLLGALGAFWLRPRLSWAPVAVVLAAAGAAAGAGALLVQDREVNAANWAVTLLVMVVLTPLHVWLVFGPPRAGAKA